MMWQYDVFKLKSTECQISGMNLSDRFQATRYYNERVIPNFLPFFSAKNMCLGTQKNRLIEMVLLSTHKICFG